MNELLVALVGFLGGLVGGILSFYGAIKVDKRVRKDLEKDETRRKKVEILRNLLGARYVLNSEYHASSEEVMVFNTAMALFPIYFFDSREVREKHDAFQHSVANRMSTADHNLLELKAAGREAGLELLDSHVGRVLTVPAGPMVPVSAATPPTAGGA